MKETLYKEVQEILENDLSCAICQDIYINPLILNCSHSFCKFCVYRWLSKRPGCPQCRMTVSFQAENLALRNIINKMIQKSSPQFQSTRSTNVSQRLKDEEAQEKEGVVPKLVIKNGSQSANPNSDNNSSNINNNNNRYNREHTLALSNVHERSSRLLASVDHDYVVNFGIGDYLATLQFDRSDSEDDEWSYDDRDDDILDADSSEDDDDIPSDDHNDVTFELGSSSEESAESSDEGDDDDDDDEDMDDNDDLDMDDIGLSDMESSDNNDDNEEDRDADVDGDFRLETSFSQSESSSESSAESSDDDEEEVEIDDSSTEIDSEVTSSNGNYANWPAGIADDVIALPDTESDLETTSDDEVSGGDDLTEEYDQSDDDSRDASEGFVVDGWYNDDEGADDSYDDD